MDTAREAHTVLGPPTPEMVRWARRLAPLLRARSWLGTALVTPIAHFANGSLDFQAYLYRIFHRSVSARVAHGLAMPGIVALALALLFELHPALGVVGGAALTFWYARVGVANALPLLGAVGAALALALTAAAAWWSANTPTSASVAGLLALGLAQTLSHAAEPSVPPRVSAGPSWVPSGDFFARGVPSVLRAAAMLVPGLANELWASWRLLPIIALDLLWTAGYAPARARAIADLVEAATLDGDPAIHFIGTGGSCTTPYP